MKAIIVDDEPRAIELLKSYLNHFSTIELAGTFRNALKALDFLQEEKVELILLDINMPHLSGIALSRMLDKKTNIVFTTAYAEYAVESYEVEALDYLLKPISLERFTKAINKALNVHQAAGQTEQELLLIKSGSKNYRVKTDDILYLAKDGNYMVYHLAQQKILAREPVAKALEKLPAQFLQIHKSYIININHVVYHEKGEVAVGGKLLPISASHQERFYSLFKK